MQECFKAVHWAHPMPDKALITRFGWKNTQRVRAFHQSFPEYQTTPLAHLKRLAGELGLEDVFVKDESYRFGLNAFKVLGGSYAIGSYTAKRLGMDLSELPYDRLVSTEIKSKLGELTFVTATDGNHGRSGLWRALHHRLECTEQFRGPFCLLSRLGGRQRHADIGQSPGW